MEKFLEHHKLTAYWNDTDEAFLIKVFNECEELIDMLHAYCFLDLLRIQKWYLTVDEKFWYTIKVTKC